MKRIFTFLLSFTFIITTFAQIGGGWDWAFSTGGNGPSLKHLAYKTNGEMVFVGSAPTAITFGATTLTAPNVLSFPGTVRFLGKISASGQPAVLKSYSNPNFSIDCATSDSSGNFYIAGGITTTTSADFGNNITYAATANVAYVAKLDASGNAQWVKTFTLGGTGSTSLQIHRIAVSKQGNIFFVGFNANTTVFGGKYNTSIYKLDNAGNTLWFKDALNTSIFSNFQDTKASLNDKFIDDNENVHLQSYNTTQSFVFNGETITAPLATIGGNNYTFHISLDANGNKRFANGYKGISSSLYVDRASGNCLMEWGQYEINAGPFANLQTYTLGTNANYFSGYVLIASNGSTLLKATQPFQLNTLDIKLVTLKPDGSLAILHTLASNVAYSVGTDYLYPSDATNRAVSIIETDANWNLSKFIWGGKSTQTAAQLLAVKGSEYVVASDFGISSTSQLPTTQFGSTTLTGFTAATNFNTTYTGGLRVDLAFAKSNSANFPALATTTWLGINTNWNDAANWSNGVPIASVKAVFNGGAANYPSTFTAPTSGTLQVNAGAVVTLPTSLTIAGAIKNDGTIKINNAGFFQGLGATEWKGEGSVEFLGNALTYFFMARPFTNGIVLNSSFNTFYDMAINGVTFNTTSGKFDMGSKIVSITNSSSSSITGANASNYFTNGTLKRTIAATGTYEFPIGSSTNFQSAAVTVNNLVGVNTIAATYTNGAITGSVPNTSLGGVPITSALNAGWYSITPNIQPTSGTYNISLNLKASTNSVTDAARYTVIKRDNSATAWAVQGTYNLATVNGTTVTATVNNLTSFSDFAIGMGTTVLPVNFTSFTAKANGTTAQLQWATASEVNNKGFNVQHSLDGITYNNLGFVNGNGNSTQNNSYSFTHASPTNGNNYYRLQQIDNDGKIAYSPVQVVSFNNIVTTLSVYPNPVVSTINFNKNFAAGTSLQIINSVGQVVEKSVFSGNRYQPKAQLKGRYQVIITEGGNNRYVANILFQ